MWMLQKLNILNMDVDVDGTSKTITNIHKKLDTGVWSHTKIIFRIKITKNFFDFKIDYKKFKLNQIEIDYEKYNNNF